MKKIIISLMALLLLSSCYTKKVAYYQVLKANRNFPAITAELCGSWYPPKEYTTTETKIIRGKDSIQIDTLIIDCTETANVGNQAVIVPKTKAIIRVDTLYTTVTTQVENTAKIERLSLQNQDLQTETQQQKTKIDSQRRQIKTGITLLIVLALYTISSLFLIIKK